jgi:UDP-glucose 4-epimerase
LVTGGGGFIGSHLVDALIEAGGDVTVLDDFSTGRAGNLEAHAAHPRLRIIEGSVLDSGVVESAVRGQDAVYHLAAAVGVKNIVVDPLRSMRTNVHGTEAVLAAAFESQIPVLLASTSEIYGRNPNPPFAEDAERVLGPTWIHRWSYSSSKALDEHLAFAYADRGLPVAIVRYFNSYGPRIDAGGYGSVIARFAAQALAGKPLTVHGDGQQTRCFTYVGDTVRGTMLALRAARTEPAVFNIGSDQEVRIRDVAVMIKELLGSASPIEHVTHESYYGRAFEDTPRRVPDIRRAQERLGFTASVPLPEGLALTLEWCRANFLQGAPRA